MLMTELQLFVEAASKWYNNKQLAYIASYVWFEPHYTEKGPLDRPYIVPIVDLNNNWFWIQYPKVNTIIFIRRLVVFLFR